MNDTGAGSDLRIVVRLALPAIANSLLQTAVFLVDRIMLGHHSRAALAAMQSAGPVVWTTYSLFGAFTVGTLAVVGRSMGANQPADATSAARGSLLIAVALGTIVGALGFVGTPWLLRALGEHAGSEAYAPAESYLRVVFPATPFMLVGATTIATLQAAGNTRTPLLIGLATNGINIVGNWFLVFGHGGAPRLGAVGSATSSAIAFTLEALLGLAVLRARSSPVSLRPGLGVVAREGARRVLSVAWGAFSERAVFHLGYLVYVTFIVGLGSAAMAANQALISIESVSFLTADGCAVAASALVAQRLGSNEPARAHRSAWLAAGMCAALLSVFALVFVFASVPLVRAFRNEAQIVALGAPALRLAAVAQIPMAIAVVLAQSMRGAGATREAFVVSLLGAFAVRIAATYVCVRVLHLGLIGVWLGSTADWLLRVTVYSWRWQVRAWQRTRV